MSSNAWWRISAIKHLRATPVQAGLCSFIVGIFRGSRVMSRNREVENCYIHQCRAFVNSSNARILSKKSGSRVLTLKTVARGHDCIPETSRHSLLMVWVSVFMVLGFWLELFRKTRKRKSHLDQITPHMFTASVVSCN